MNRLQTHARTLAIALAMAIAGLGSLPAAAAPFQIDRFWGERNGIALFDDEFDDGFGPPVGGLFTGINTALYAATRTVGDFSNAEQNGKLKLDPLNNGVQTVNPFTGQPEGLFFTAAYLNVNTDDNPANAARGLKLNHTFSVQGLFDLDMTLAPAGAQSYGIRLADFDNAGASGWNDVLDLQLARSIATGQVRLFFIRRDLRLGTRNLVASAALDGSLGDQIELSFLKETAGDPTIGAGFRYVKGGVAGGAVQMLGESDVFNGETFTRPGFFAIETVTQTVALPSGLSLTLAALAAAAAAGGARRGSRHAQQ